MSGAARGSPGKYEPCRSFGTRRFSAPRRVFSSRVAIAVAPGLAAVAPLVAAGADKALDIVLHQELQHSLGDRCRKSPSSCFCSSSISGKVESVIGVSIGPWLKSANSTIADALDGHPGSHRRRGAKFHHELGR
jgi:hypothetical protein